MSIPETAAACETSPATVKRRIADAEERLSRRLGERIGTRVGARDVTSEEHGS